MTFSLRWFLFLFPLVGGLLSLPSHGKIFRTPYVHFQMNYPWTCKIFGINWVCHHSLSKGIRPALILTIATEGDPSVRLDMYQSALNKLSSHHFGTKKHLKQIMIYRHVWLEGFYDSGFVEKSVNRYAMAICCKHEKRKINVMVSLHSSSEHYANYSSEFLHIIKSLRLTKDITETLNQIRKQTAEQRQAMLSYIEKILSETDLEEDMKNQSKQKKPSLFKVLLFVIFLPIFLLAFIWLFLLYRKKGKRKKLRKRKSSRLKKRVKATKKNL